MNYEKHYNLLIEKAKRRSLEDTRYREKHHIIPRCLGGQDLSENLVELLPEEHLVAHLLLCKIHPANRKIIFAANMMTNFKRKIKPNNKIYGWVKREYSKTQRGKHQIVSEETKIKQRETWIKKYKEGYINNATGKSWSDGRRKKAKAYWESVQNLPKPQKQYKTKEEISRNNSLARKKFFADHAHHTLNTNWYTNGVDTIRLNINEEIPHGYVLGRFFKTPRKTKTLTVYNSAGECVLSTYVQHTKQLKELKYPKAMLSTASDESYIKTGYYKDWYARWND